MLNRLVRYCAKPILRRYHDLLLRVSSLETAVDCLLISPKYVGSDDVGFNGQNGRKNIFQGILKEVGFEAIVETGTYVGNTTGYMADTSHLPVWTCESNERFHALARMRLEGFDDIEFHLADSRAFLDEISATSINTKRTFFYLDAHWHEDLPLEREIEIIVDNWQEFVIMIDDFQVPGDEGYGYDDYGRKKSLTLSTFSGVFSRHDLVPFFPAMPSSEESGHRRGCVILSRRGRIGRQLANVSSLNSKEL